MTLRRELESALEQRCVQRIEDLGGQALKLVIPGVRGFPDRTVLTHGVPNLGIPGHVFFAEFKRLKSGRVSAQQERWHKILTGLGFGVYFIETDAEFEAALQKEMGR